MDGANQHRFETYLTDGVRMRLHRPGMPGAWFVKVHVNVCDVVMRVLVKMEIASPAEGFDRGTDTQEDDHECNGKLKKAGKSFRDDDAHRQHETPHEGQR